MQQSYHKTHSPNHRFQSRINPRVQPHPVTSGDVSDTAEAVLALFRVSGYSPEKRHDRLFLACLAAADEHGRELHITHDEMGARMIGEVEPYRCNMTEAERKRHKRKLAATFKRAYDAYEADALATGLWFIEMESGGIGEADKEKQTSIIRVDVASITAIIERARASHDFTTYRRRCFERAAESVCAEKPRRYEKPNGKLKIVRPREERDQSKQDIKTWRAYGERMYNRALDEGGDTEALLDELIAAMRHDFDVSFPNKRATKHQAEQSTQPADTERAARMDARISQIESINRKPLHTIVDSTKAPVDYTPACSTPPAVTPPPVTLPNPKERVTGGGRKQG